MPRYGLLRFALQQRRKATCPQPFRRPLLRKRLRSLDVILRGRHCLHGRVLPLLGDRLFQRSVKPALDRLLGSADRHRRILGNRFRPALGGGERFAGRNHLIHKAEFESLLGRDVARGEDHAHGALETNLPRQPVHAAGEGCEPDARLGQRKRCILRRDDEVAGQRDLKTAAHRHAVDGGDDRLVAIEPRGEAGETALVPAALAACRLPLQVVAGAERLVAGAGDDRYPLLGVGGEIVEHLVELEMRVDMQRIVHFRPRQRDDRDRPLARHPGEFQVHVCSRFDFLRRRILATIIAPARRPMPSNYATRLRVPRPVPLLDLGMVFQPKSIRAGALA